MKAIYIIKSKIRPEKFYIGSAVNFINRKNTHLTTLRCKKHKNKKLQDHFNKFGIDDIYFEIIENVKHSKDLISREQFYIDTMNPWFNICLIANSSLGVKRSDETRKKISESKKGVKHNPIHHEARVARQIGVVTRTGWNHSVESKLKITNNHSRKTRVIQIFNCGCCTKQWDTIVEASNELNISQAAIGRCCGGHLKSAGGFKWKYLDK